MTEDRQILFIQGGGAGTHDEWDNKLVESLCRLALFLLVEVAGVPFYTKSSPADWVVQLVFGVIGLLGLVAWVSLLRGRRRALVAAKA
ncbi:MAG: hypothetical protein ABI903_00175 [Actinomycetota bacterium]